MDEERIAVAAPGAAMYICRKANIDLWLALANGRVSVYCGEDNGDF